MFSFPILKFPLRDLCIILNINDFLRKNRNKLNSPVFTVPKDRSQKFKVVYKASCWDCDDSYIGKTKRRLQDSILKP